MHSRPAGGEQGGILIPCLTDGETQACPSTEPVCGEARTGALALGPPVQCSFHTFGFFYAVGFSWRLREVLERVPLTFLRAAQGARSGLALQILHPSYCVEEGGVRAEHWADGWSLTCCVACAHPVPFFFFFFIN